METNRNDKRTKARNRVAQLKGFYIHALVYVLVNLFIVVASIIGQMNAGESFNEALFNFGTFATPVFWGIGLAFHAAKTFGYSPFFSKDWEERQIKKYMEDDRREAEKFSKSK
ncbi:2TM domain-containing protein [Pricia sp. S334]|uniref:2TM domain-containing protein n=1 Tax=Pricia mediterranea TaxID=3076079 RepID=A0ABU3L371_9FLAO|nr:2TM domain-containing protein [Pricia sp. S334]MDT7827882.1 2TM domain-containing protein [Pricia sp. S334]